MKKELANIIVIKRDGKKVKFDSTKIAVAIKKGFEAVDSEYSRLSKFKILLKML